MKRNQPSLDSVRFYGRGAGEMKQRILAGRSRKKQLCRCMDCQEQRRLIQIWQGRREVEVEREKVN